VGAFTHDIGADYHGTHYVTGNCVVVCCGSVDHEALVGLCERYLGEMTPGVTSERGEVAVQIRPPFSIMKKDTEQAHVIYGMPGIPSGDDDRFVGALMDSALGGPMSSRLFQEVREKRGLAYAVYATTMPYLGTAQFGVYAGTRPSNLEEVVAIIRTELAKMLDKGLEADELERIREYVTGHAVLGMESTQSRMIRLGRNLVNGLEVLSIDEVIARYRAITLDDIRRVAERVYTQDPTIAVISPLDEVELQGKLASL
jgi:predicted Zn-dependent peptidase